jgi:hypothetical protein
MSDVIKVLGTEPLNEFPWGVWVKDTVNLFVDENARLMDESTGEDVLASLNTLPEEQRELILRAQLDPAHHCVVSPVGGGMVLEIDEQPLEPAAEVKALVTAMQTPQFLVSSTMVGLVVLASLWMVSTLSVHDDVHILEAIVAFVKVFGLAIP